MDNNNFFLDYAITVSVLSNHKLDLSFYLSKEKKYYDRLTPKEQDEYLEYLLETTVRMSKDTEHFHKMNEGTDYRKYFTFELEDHVNLKLTGGLLKRHLHGVFYKCTKDDIATYKFYLHKLLRVYNDKQQSKCLKVVPIYYDKGWTNYMKKDQTLSDLESDLREYNNMPINPIDN